MSVYYPPEVGRGKYWVGNIPTVILPSCQYIYQTLHDNCIDMNRVGL